MKLPIFTLLFYSPAESLFLSPQAALWAPAWAKRSKKCANVDKGASTPKATPRLVPQAQAAQHRLKHASAG
jgi:hypothetical protein